MDGTKFDGFIRSLNITSSRRITFSAIAAGLGAAVLGRIEPEEAEAAPNRCLNVGKSCKKRRGQPKLPCCGKAKCRGKRCQCVGQMRRCDGDCIGKNQCCRDHECTGNQAGACVRNRCRPAFKTCTNANGNVAFRKKGPGDPPASDGSVEFTVGPANAVNDWAHLRFDEYAGTPLSALQSLQYSVYVHPLNDGTCPSQNPYMALYVTANGTDHIIVSTTVRPSPTCNDWQLLDLATAGLWWMPTNPGFAPQSNPRPLSDFITNFPGIAIRNAVITDTQCPTALGGLRLEAGEWPGGGGTGNMVSNVSFLRVVANGQTTTYRF